MWVVKIENFSNEKLQQQQHILIMSVVAKYSMRFSSWWSKYFSDEFVMKENYYFSDA